jgi:hypothetical protein
VQKRIQLKGAERVRGEKASEVEKPRRARSAMFAQPANRQERLFKGKKALEPEPA